MKQEQSPSILREWLITNRAGFSLVEVLLSSAIFVLLVTALVGAYLYGQEATAIAGNRARATMFAEEGLEAVRNIRDAGFSNLVDGTYGLTTSSNQWNLSSVRDTNGIFSRQVVISTIDSKRKSITANVAWQQNPQRTGSVSLTTRLTNWLISGGAGNWNLATSSGSIDLSGNQDGVKIQVSGSYAYLIRSNSVNNFVIVDITNPDAPSVTSTISIVGTPTNLFVSGAYAYVTSNDNSQELQVVDIANPASPSIVGSYNAPGNADANGVYIIGTNAYITRANQASEEFSVINISNPASPTELGVLDLGATGYEVVVLGNYAFIVSASNTQELQIVNVSNPASMSIVASLNLPGNIDATTISIIGNTLLIGQGKDFRTIDITNPLSPLLLGTLAISSTINDISIDLAGNYVFLADQDSSAEFQVIDITTLVTPILSTTFNITGTSSLLGVAYSSVNDRVYGVGQSNSQELTVFAPQ